MQLDRVKQAVGDWFREKRYAQGKTPLIVVGVVLLVCLLWISSFFVGGDSYPVSSPPNTPRDREAAAITEQLHADERFRHIAVTPSSDDDRTLLVSGEVYTKADREALMTRLQSITSTFEVKPDAIVSMDGN